MNTLGKRIKFVLKAQNRTLKYLGHELGVPQQKLSRWINGHAEMPSSVLFQISKILGVSMDWLMDGEIKDDSSRRRRNRKKDKNTNGGEEHISDRHPEEA